MEIFRHTSPSKSVWKTELEDTDASYFQNKLGPRRNGFFSASVVNSAGLTVESVEKFKRQPSEFGYWDMEVVLAQTVVF